MVNRALFRKLCRDILRRKWSLAVLTAIMTVGVSCYVGMSAAWHDMDGSRSRYYANYRLADFSIDVKRLPAAELSRLATLPNIRELRGRIHTSVLVDLPGLAEAIPGTAISLPGDRRPVLNDVQLRTGTWFSGGSGREVILNDAFARANGLKPGSRLKVLLVDRQHELLVVGTAMSPEFVYLIPASGGLAPDPQRFGVMYLPEKFLQESCDLDGAYNQVIGLAHDRSATALGNTLQLAGDKLDAFGVLHMTPVSEQPSVRFLADELQGLSVSSKVTPGLFLVVAVLVLNVLMKRRVAQQRVVIGTLRAVGYPGWRVTAHYLAYGAAVGAAGGLTGILCGWWFQSWLITIYRQFYALPDLQPGFYPGISLSGMFISLGAATAGTLSGARSAARLAPADAMRPPQPERGGRILPEHADFLWRRLSFRSKLILRTVFRNPFRSGVNMVAAAIATAIIVMALSQMSSLDYLMHYEFRVVSHQDITVALRDPKPVESQSELNNLPLVSFTEGQLNVAATLSNGPFRRNVGITGLVPGNILYTPLDERGVPIGIPDAGIVLSRKLADLLGAKPGDTITLRPLIGRRQAVRTPVVALADTFLGLGAYANLEYLGRLLGEERVANTLAVATFHGSPLEPLYRQLKERPSVLGITERNRALRQLEDTFGAAMGTMIGLMVLFAGVISFGSVLNTALVSLSERQREAATLRVLGHTPAQVAWIFTGESLLLNIVGIAIGLGGGIFLAQLIATAYNTELFRFPAIIHPGQLVQSALLMLGFVAVAQLALFRVIRRMDWLETMKVRE